MIVIAAVGPVEGRSIELEVSRGLCLSPRRLESTLATNLHSVAGLRESESCDRPAEVEREAANPLPIRSATIRQVPTKGERG